MKQKNLMWQMLPGFIPLFIYILADEIWGTKIGLIVAVVVGIGELLFYLIKDKKIDKFILFDTMLLVTLGGISFAFDNDVFFKLKPALMGLIGSILLGLSAFTPRNLVLGMSKRYLKNVEFNEAQQKEMQRSLRKIFYVFTAYTALVFYSVWFMSDTAWAFVSGGLFYIVFGLYFVEELIKSKIRMKKHRVGQS